MYGYLTNSQCDQLPIEFIAQTNLVEHCTSIAKLIGLKSWSCLNLSGFQFWRKILKNLKGYCLYWIEITSTYCHLGCDFLCLNSMSYPMSLRMVKWKSVVTHSLIISFPLLHISCMIVLICFKHFGWLTGLACPLWLNNTARKISLVLD